MKKSLFLFVVCFVSVFIFVGSAHAAMTVAKLERQNWVKVTTKNFSVVSDKRQKDVIELVESLERFRTAFELFFGIKLSDNIRPVKVILTGNTDMDGFLAGGSSSVFRKGYFVDSSIGNYAMVEDTDAISGNSTLTMSPRAILFHEYTHYLTANLSRANLPRWFSEGFADFMSETQFPNDKTIKFGVPIQRHLRNITEWYENNNWVEAEDLFTTNNFSGHSMTRIWQTYAQGWLTVHYFMIDQERRPKLMRFLQLLVKGAPVDQAVASGFEMTYAELDAELKKYSRANKHNFGTATLDKSWDASELKVEKLQASETLYEVGEFMLSAHDLKAKSRPLFERSLELDDTNPDSYAALAKTYLTDDLAMSTNLIEKAKAEGLKSPWLTTMSGHVNARRLVNSKDNTSKENFRKLAIENYQDAINSQKVNVEAELAIVALYAQEGNWQQAKQVAEAAFLHAPSNEAVRRRLLMTYLATGQEDYANRVVSLIKNNQHWSADSEKAFDEWLVKLRARFAQ